MVTKTLKRKEVELEFSRIPVQNRAKRDLKWIKWAQIKTEKTIETMPELKPLQDRLLSLGGDWVALQYEPDVEALLSEGQLVEGKIIFKPMVPCQCHSNCAQFWDKHPKTCKIGTGWALSTDGIWRQHTWILRGKTVIETTQPRTKYYGIILENEEANLFWWYNH